jgi:23S rRNA (guanosine2251-2'-O)-methyltransferase
MIYGIHPVTEALRAQRRVLRTLYFREGGTSGAIDVARELARHAGVDTRAVDADELQRRVASRQHQGLVLDCGELPKFALKEWLATASADATVVALDQVEDPQNVGGILRSADFLGAAALLVHRSRSAPLSAAASKASAGALERFPVIEVSNLAQSLQTLKKEGFWIAGSALDESAKDYRSVVIATPRVLVLGSEGSGLRRLTRERCDEILYIPRVGTVESLNVNVAAALLLAQWMA